MSISDRYQEEKRRFLENCTRCGLCAQGCPILQYTDLKHTPPSDIQKGVFDFLEKGDPNKEAYIKAFACMECLKCTSDMCPENLDPMLMNEFIKAEYISQGLAAPSFCDSSLPDSTHRILPSIMVSALEYRRITTPRNNPSAPYVFFPGCNIHLQPEKLLNALDVMDATGSKYSFLPGLDNCCGDNCFFSGMIEEGCKKGEDLVNALSNLNPQTVILWCPTCHCRFDQIISSSTDLPFEVISFPQFLAQNMNRLSFKDNVAATVTLHEACKSAYRGLDLEAPREILKRLPGIKLTEMKHHGRDTMCCGSGAISWFPKSCEQIRRERLEEAADTEAQKLVTICHYCSQTFAAEESGYNFTVTNYIDLVASALSIHREDKFKKYMQWGDPEMILQDAAPYIEESPFETEQILEAVRSVFTRRSQS